ncbi:MAG TPA: MFS transporter [Vicinamibacterales bacterium]|nr:MFS transporter [Vicinamibacterales bacterium]
MEPLTDRIRRALPFRGQEAQTALLMFAYSFLAMTAYNILKPLTRSKFITTLGADNLPYVQLAAGLFIGVLMHVYGVAIQRLPRRHVIPVTQGGIIVLLVAFWALFKTEATWVTVAFYVLGLILGILLISQFWTLANDIYDARQAKRLFGFIGGGSSLGGATGAAITAFVVDEVGSNNLLLVSAAVLAICTGIVVAIVRRHEVHQAGTIEDERGVGGREAIRLLFESRQLQILALVIGFAAAGGVVVEQQLNMAAEAMHDELDGDAIAQFLAQVTVYLSLAGFALQIFLTSRIHRSFGIAVALLTLPVTLGASASIILLTGALSAVAGARVMDATLRYTLDKTTREVLFLPLPTDLKYRAKPFIDVTMDRFSKATAAILCLVLIKPWGLGLDWRRLSYASLVMMGVWIVVALVARREYLRSFRASLDARAIAPGSIRTPVADGATVETLVEELSNPDAAAVIYAIEMLEALDKRHLVSPLLLHHESPRVRVRALAALDATRPDIAIRWRSRVEQIVHDADVDVRAAALRALAVLANEEASVTVRRFIDDTEPRVAAAAATILAQSPLAADVDEAEATLLRLASDTRDTGVERRTAAAEALARTSHPRFRVLLLPLLYDDDVVVVRSAIRSARALGASDGLFLPGLLSLLGHRHLKSEARDALVGYGPDIVPALRHVLLDTREEAWVRRHVPATLGYLPSQASLDALTAALDDPDGFLRHKAITALARVCQVRPDLQAATAVFEKAVLREASRYCNHLTLQHDFRQHPRAGDSLLQRALDDKLKRTLDRLYRLLGLLQPAEDLAAVRNAIEHGDPRRRAAALEYLDNILGATVRKRVLPLIDESPIADKVRHASQVLNTRPRGVEDTLAQLVHDDDHVVAAAAVQFVTEERFPALEDDLKYAAEHGSKVRRWVAEVARRALVGRTAAAVPAEGASLSVVDLAARLRTIPVFAFVWVDELFRLAEAGQETRYAAGRSLAAGAVKPDVHLLLEGTVRVTTDTGAYDVTAPAVVGAREALRGTAMTGEVAATTPVITLRIAGADFLTMVSDNALLAQGLFRTLLAPSDVADPHTEEHLLAPAPTGARHRPIDTALLLRRHPAFVQAGASQLMALVAAAREVTLAPGQPLFEPFDPSACVLVVEGALSLEAEGRPPETAGPGSVLGVVGTLAGSPWRRRGVADRPGRALRLGRDDLFDVLTDHADLLQGLFGAVWDLQSSRPLRPPTLVQEGAR